MNKKILIISFILVSCICGFSQELLEKTVSLNYVERPLGEVLQDLSNRYQIRFTYSSDFVPLEAKVSLNVEAVPLEAALESLFGPTFIDYSILGNHIVLRGDVARTLEVNTPKYDEPATSQESDMSDTVTSGTQTIEVAESIEPKVPEAVVTEAEEDHSELLDEERIEELKIQRKKNSIQGVTVTLVPGISTYYQGKDTIKKGLALNIISGRNIHMQGIEIGLFLNESLKTFNGFQIAGFGNITGGDFEGGQFAGLFNFNKAHTGGIQAAGLVNTSRSTDGFQIAGLANMVPKEAKGFQIAGLANFSEDSREQISGLINMSTASSRLQISGLVNFAKTVEIGQVSGLVNIAKEVKGFQIGLVNVADTASGPVIGLVNIVKKGYRRVELAGSEALHTSLGFKFGTHLFYSHIFAGVNYNGAERTVDNNPFPVQIDETDVLWGVGVGLGSLIPISNRTSLNIEISAAHINEGEFWTDDNLNLLSTAKAGIDYRLGRRTSVFLAPSINVMVSELYNSDTNKYGSELVAYSFYDHTSFATHRKPVNVQMWFGITGGFRF